MSIYYLLTFPHFCPQSKNAVLYLHCPPVTKGSMGQCYHRPILSFVMGGQCRYCVFALGADFTLWKLRFWYDMKAHSFLVTIVIFEASRMFLDVTNQKVANFHKSVVTTPKIYTVNYGTVNTIFENSMKTTGANFAQNLESDVSVDGPQCRVDSGGWLSRAEGAKPHHFFQSILF